jgi:hypothetical protein
VILDAQCTWRSYLAHHGSRGNLVHTGRQRHRISPMSDAAAERPDEAAAGTAGAGVETETERAILATVGRGDLATASRLAATRRGTSPLVAALHRFMTRGPIADPYTEPAAFREFIESGDNPALYGAVIDALRDLHGSLGAEVVLDIGCGDGRVTAATLSESCRGVDLVEPSAELIEDASRRLADLGTHLEVRGIGRTHSDSSMGSLPTNKPGISLNRPSPCTRCRTTSGWSCSHISGRGQLPSRSSSSMSRRWRTAPRLDRRTSLSVTRRRWRSTASILVWSMAS